MKRNINSIIFAVFFASMFILGILPKVQAQEECSLATLQGSYLVTGRGDAPGYNHDAQDSPASHIAVWIFDGEGNISGFSTDSVGGMIRRQSRNGTYELDPDPARDCAYTLTFETIGPAVHFDLFVTRDGSEGAALRTDDGFIGSRSIKKR